MRIIYDLLGSFGLVGLGTIQLDSHSGFNLIWLIFYIIVFIIFGIMTFRIAHYKKVAYKNIELDFDTADSKFDFNTSFWYPIAYLVAFALISHQLYLFDNDFFEITPTKHNTINNEMFVNFEWMVFAFDNLIRAVFFDFLETFHITFSGIDSQNKWILTFILFFKVSLTYIFWKSLFNLYRATKKIKI